MLNVRLPPDLAIRSLRSVPRLMAGYRGTNGLAFLGTGLNETPNTNDNGT
jgi:hypothetical protein